jgi:DNA replication and repair protein RecF
MHITTFECHTFRCLREIDFAPSPGVNLVCGANAQGKTSLLEAILFVATSKSHRSNVESELVMHGEDGFRIKVTAQRAQQELALEANWWQGAKRVKVNGVAQTRVSDILGRLNVVFFTPDDVGLVREGASSRRRFLDMELAQLDQGYLQALQEYRQILRQRNELLRAFQVDETLLEVWDVQLARHAEILIAQRDEFIAELSVLAEKSYQEISGNTESFSLVYKPNIKPGESVNQQLARNRKSDIKRKSSNHGPHRDDLEILIDGRSARTFASQGQQKSAALAMKLAEVALIKERNGEFPVLLLDEVLAELDAERSRRLFASIPDTVQCIVATTELEHTTERFGGNHALFRMEGGGLTHERT